MPVHYGGGDRRATGRRRSPRRVAGGLLALAMAAIGTVAVPVATPTAYADHDHAPEAQFNWDLTRYHDRDGDGFADAVRAPEEAQPAQFEVDLNGCSSHPSEPEAWHRWNVNGTELLDAGCQLKWMPPGEGAYPVSLTVQNVHGQTDSITRLVVVEDLVVVSIGDSLGSGQGNPHTPKDGDQPPVWEDQRCHRSAIAGSAQAARWLELGDPETSITFVHLACSGAKIIDPGPTQGGLLDGYEGQDDAFTGPGAPPPLPPQLDDIQALLGARHIDALMLSVGINDVEFGTMVMDCVKMLRCDRKHAPLFDANLRLLSDAEGRGGRYAQLAGELARRFPELRADPSKVFINEYPDPTHSNGARCPSMIAGQIGGPEMVWASTVVPRLNERVKAAAAVHGWTPVDGIREQYLDNGECNNKDHWFVQLHESIEHQGNFWGTLHPNAKGHRPLRDRFLETVGPKLPPKPPAIVVKGLAVDGQVGPGSAPTVEVLDRLGVASQSVTLDGAAYTPGTPVIRGGAHTLVVEATNRAGLRSSLTIPFAVVPSDLTVTLSPSSVKGGSPVTATVELNEPALYPGATVDLASSRPDLAMVPANVVVPIGSTTGTATVTTAGVAADTAVTITASAAGVSRTADLVVTPARLNSVALIPDAVAGGEPAKARILLNGPAPAGGVAVPLRSENPAVVVVPATWTVPGNETFVDVPIRTNAVGTETHVVISATLGTTSQATLRVFPNEVDVPPVVGMRAAVAARIVLDAGLTIEHVPPELNGHPDAWVKHQDPAGGTTAPFGSAVRLTYRLGSVE